MWGDEDYDEDLLRAMEESKRMYEEVEVPRLSQQVRAPSPVPPFRDDCEPGPSTSKTRDPFKTPYPSSKNREDVQDSELYTGSEAEGFNLKAGKVWVYPTSDKYPVRTYQRDIVEKALFTNTLVSLPTGLGKTFIAAVVMFNYYMWYPKGKIIFMAPTKPLVAQQIENCINIVGIPESDTAEMTGALTSKMRAVMWKEKRVFFLTPQCVQNDLTSNICPANDVKCVVIDEAHRALGDHAYAQVIRILCSYEARFRVLALSATPGSDLEAVQKVLANLMISHIELRTEDSPDITQYTHQRNLELMVVDVGPTIYRIKAKFVGIATEYAKSLQQQRLLFGNVGSMARFSVLKEWESFRREGTNGLDPARINKFNTDFALVHTFVHGLELLQTYGLRLLLNHMKGALSKGDLAANRLSVNEDLKSLLEEIESILNPIEIDNEDGNVTKKRCIYGHPKLDRLQEIVVSHFENFERKGEPTRTIVFCEYREGVKEICDMLKNFQPLVKPVAFMGQAGKGNLKGISQKQQLEIMDKFRKGIYNTLVSTSVGEEGLDIGEVDLIICFDAKNSPIRQVQRMGRTGRKRQGKIIMLVTRGKEETKYNQGLCKKRSVGSVLLNRENLASHLLEESPRMLPPGIEPKYTERKVIQAPSKPKSNQQDLRKMFLKRSTGSGAGTSKSSTAVARPHIGKVACLTADEFAEMKLVWDNIEDCCKFDKIPTRKEFWNKSADYVESQQLDQSNVDLATYLEFMRFKQRTHVVGNSSGSLLLTKLLTWADDRRDADQSAGFSQLTSTQLWPAKSRKRGRPPTSDAKSTNPPKKRGRPKKVTPNPSPVKEAAAPENLLFPLNKPKSKAQFIDDDDECSPIPLQNQPATEGPSTSVFLAPPPPLPLPSKSAERSTKASVAVDEIIIESDEDDDLNISGFGYMSSQVNRQDLYSELSRALRNQAPDEDEDECIICDALFPCKSLNELVLQNQGKDEVSWNSVRKSLEEALILVPELTKDALSKYYKPIGQSQRFVSLLPKYDLTDGDVFDGMLCGGMGDLSNRRSLSPDIACKSRSSPKVDPNDKITEVAKEVKFEIGLDDTQNEEGIVSNGIPACSTPRKEQPMKEEKYEFEESLNYFQLSDFNDLFVSQSDKKVDKVEKAFHETATDPDVKEPYSLKGLKSPVKSNSQLEMRSNVSPARPSKPVQKDCVTPPKMNSCSSEQVSPILGSQVTKKPRLRLRKKPTLNESSSSNKDNLVSQNQDLSGRVCEKPEAFSPEEIVSSSSKVVASANSFKPEEVDFDICDDNFFVSSEEDIFNETKGDDFLNEAVNFEPNEVVSSSSQRIVSPNSPQPQENNFDLYDDNFFESSGNVDCNKSKYDNSVKEAVRKTALKAKETGKSSELTYTQEMDKFYESSLTQIMQMIGTEEKNAPIARPDCSSSPQAQTKSSKNAIVDENINEVVCIDNNDSASSEKDLFADCDDSFLFRINSTEFRSPKQQSPPAAAEVCQSPSFFKGSNPISVFIQQSENTKLSVNEKNEIKEELISGTDRSQSPVLKPIQNVRRPSKLSLKKKKSEVFKRENEQQGVEDKAVSSIVQTPPHNDQSKTKISLNEKELLDSNLEVDFSIYGDEFNNSWLLSQEKHEESTKTNKADEKCEGLSNYSRTTDCMNYSQKKVDVKKSVLGQDTRSARDSSPENELDVAFAKLDAARKQRKKSFEGSSSSTSINPSGTRSWLQNNKADLPSFSKVQPSNSKPTWSKKLSKPNLFSLAKNKQVLSSRSPPKNGWLSNKKSQVSKNDQSPHNTSGAKKSLNLADFCDDSLLEGLDSQKPAVSTPEKPKASSTALLLQHKEVNENDDDVIVLSSSDDENVKTSKKNKKNCFLNVTTSSEEGWLSRQSASVNKQSTDSPHVKKRNSDALHSSSSSDSFIQKPRCFKKQKTELLPDTSSDFNSTQELSNFCDKSLLNELLNDSHVVATEKNKVQPRRRQDFLSSSDEDDFVKVDKKSTKVKKNSNKGKKAKKSKKANGFIMSEAEESDDGRHNSSDGESTSLDELDSSFINDSQPEASQSVVDIHAKYLQSVKSPALGLNKFKIPTRLAQVDINDVYSQYPDADELNQTYADDSFCVDNEPTQYEPEMSVLEIAEARLKAKRKEKRRLKKAMKDGKLPPKRNRVSESDESVEEVPLRKKRLKRIRVLEETVCEDRVTPLEAPTIKLVRSPASTAVTETPVAEIARNSASNEMDNADLAQLLDDDLDFSAIPDPTPLPVTMKPQQAQQSSSKFVKKTPMLLSDGSTLKVNPQYTWNVPRNGLHLNNNLPSTSRQAAASNSAPSYPRPSSHVTSVVEKNDVGTGVVSSKSKTNSNAVVRKVFLIASSRQIAASPDLLRVLRVNYQITIIPHSVPDADFIISWRLGVSRILSSDLKDKKKLEELVKKLKLSYGKPHVIVENDRIKSLSTSVFQKKGKKGKVPAPVEQAPQTQSPWSSNISCGNAALLRQAGVQLLFSQNFDETARFLAKLGRKETDAGHGIPAIANNLSDEMETRLEFFCSLPSINYAFALKLLGNFATLSEFLNRCSSVVNIATNLGVDINAAKRIYSVICESHV